MDTNDVVRRIRYAYDIKDRDMRKIFELGGITISKAEYFKMMKKPDNAVKLPAETISRSDLEGFLNGLIVSQRGQKKDESGKPLPADFSMKTDSLINNVAIKKIKIAMAYTTDDLMAFMSAADFKMSNNELTDILRKPGTKKYKAAGDQFLRKLLLGIAITNRPEIRR